VAVYLDSSAVVKLAVREPESAALRRYLRRRRPLVSSALARTEVLRALRPAGADALARGQEVLRRLDLVRVNDQLLSAAGILQPAELRSLDALHLATARDLGSDVKAVVTYDARMATAGTALGLRIVQPR
jgi:predicted nucleic acid-binding protein